MHKQISLYADYFLSPYSRGYRTGFSTQKALLSLTKKRKTFWIKRAWNGCTNGPFYKAGDLLIAKLNVYSAKRDSLKSIKNYLIFVVREKRLKEALAARVNFL